MGSVCTYITSLYPYVFDSESPLLSLWYFSLYHKTNIYAKCMRRLLRVTLTAYHVRDTFHTRSHTNVECFSLWQNPNKSYACALESCSRYKNATVAGYLLELLLTWFKKYHLLFPNYTSAFISSFNWLYQRDHNVIPAAETLPSKCIKTCQIVQKHPETAQVLLQTPWHLLNA